MSKQIINMININNNEYTEIAINKKGGTKETKIINIKRTKSKKLVELDELENVLEASSDKIGKITIDDDKEKNKNTIKKMMCGNIFLMK